ncbi:MAG: ABC transporter ATP-binding protein [Candidatus Contubernalis sp.]|nr:ABC transporter ATP-binding protein [Candidatus Contubernalis sp.]
MNKEEALPVRVVNVSKAYVNSNGKEVPVLKKVNLRVCRGEMVCLMGPSGCGKTTLLNLLAGFDLPTEGEIFVNGRKVEAPGPDRGVVFQEDALFPWLNVRENISYGLHLKKMTKKEIQSHVNWVIEATGLKGFEGHFPGQLSGGMKQRVSLSRVLVNSPDILLMDEPFASLDAQTRSSMQKLLIQLWNSLRQTVLFITHDVDEAIFLGDRIYLMSPSP